MLLDPDIVLNLYKEEDGTFTYNISFKKEVTSGGIDYLSLKSKIDHFQKVLPTFLEAIEKETK